VPLTEKSPELPAGAYLVKLEASSQIRTLKMGVVR